MLVIKRAVLVIGKDFVGLGDGFESDFGFFAFFGCDFVGVRGECGLLFPNVSGL